MTIKIVTSEIQAQFLKNYESVGIESVETKEADEGGFYDVTIKFNKYFDADIIAQTMFGAGITYGLDLQYSHYDNNVPR